VPSFFVSGVFGFGAGGGQEDFGLSMGGGQGDDVPDGDGDQVGGDEVELGEAVGDSVGVDVALEGGGALAAGGFDLDAKESSVAFDGNIVGGGVSPGTGDGEALFGGAGHEEKLGPFAALFGVGDVDGWR